MVAADVAAAQCAATAEAVLTHTVAQAIGHKLRHGDGLVGWEGDPDMWLTAAVPVDERGRVVPGAGLIFEVWTLDAHRQPMLVVGRPYLDDRLIVDVVRADTRRFDVAAQVRATNEAVAARQQAQVAEATEAAGDKLHWALLKGGGHLYSGTTRRQYAVGGIGD